MIVGVMCLLTLLAAPCANAAPTWLAPINVSEEGHKAGAPRVAFDKQGDAVVVWERKEGADGSMEAAFRQAGGAWQAPVIVGSCGESVCEPSVAFDGQGDAVVVWEAYNGVTFVVEASYRPAGGAWRTPVYLSPEEIPGTAHPQIAFDEQGDAMAIWNRGGSWGGAVQEAFMPAGGAGGLQSISPSLK